MRNYIMALCLTFIISSCTTLYIPNRINVPELQKKGDLRASAAVGLGGFNFQTAYAVNKNLGILANYYNTESRDYHTHFLYGGAAGLEVGAGYYHAPKSFILESYGTLGMGSLYHRSQDNDINNLSYIHKLDADFWRVGLQSSATLRDDLVSLSVMFRFNQMNYYNITSSVDGQNDILAHRLRADNTHYFAEPGVQAGLGYKYIRFNAQLHRSFHLGQSWFPFDRYHYSVGMQVGFGVFKKSAER